MRVGLLQEGDVTAGVTPAQRYRQMIDEVVRADELGFSAWGTSEQHFSAPRYTVSAPEVLYAAIASLTSRIILRPMAAVLLAWNHPILVAERLATLDIVSGGRAELTTARSNNLFTLDAFGVDASTTKAQWADSLEVLVKCLRDEVVEHDGPFWKIPPRPVVPRCVSEPHPALSVAASSVASHLDAGRKGLGVIGFENYFGFDYLAKCLEAYREGLSEGTSIALGRNEYAGLFVATAYCAETREEARRIARKVALGYFDFIVDLYTPLGQKAGYQYLDTPMRQLADYRGDLDFLVNETPSVMIGTPTDFIERLQRLADMGVDEVLLRIDGVPHDDILRSLELIGAEVIPAVDALAVSL